MTIKIALIVVFVVFAVFLMFPRASVRSTAIRRIVLAFLLLLTVIAVVVPSVVNRLANFVGIGRGTDLLLYGLIVVFIGNAIVTQRRHRLAERQVTLLARKIAISEAPAPDAVRAGNGH